ncbi:MAG: hypothetical protein ACXVX9_15035 [Mycobacteriaceae bacterium]
MTVFEIHIHEVRSAAVQLGVSATAVGEGAAALGELRLSPAQAGAPDGDVASQAVRRFAERASRRLADNSSSLRAHSADLRTACAGYAEVDQATAVRLRAAR